MNCRQCGNVLDEKANFCPRCGVSAMSMPAPPPISYASTIAGQISDEPPLLVVRPRFIGWFNLLKVGPIGCFMMAPFLVACFFFSCLGSIVMTKSGSTFGFLPLVLLILVAAGIFITGLTVIYFLSQRAYAKTEYRFYRDRLDYYCGFLILRQNSILYRNVQEVQMRQGPVQKKYGLATIVLMIPAGYAPNGGRIGDVAVADVENGEALYEQIKQMVRASQVGSVRG
jgi:membrane protein YdbS with pleckstrin-like domain